MRKFLAMVFTTLLLFAGIGTAAGLSPAEIENLRTQVRSLDKDLGVQKEVSAIRLDALEKRLTDATQQHANQLSVISNQNTTVGHYISYTSISITMIVTLAGFITYFSAKNRAEKEAREASGRWFKEHSDKLSKEIEDLRRIAEQATAEIAKHQIDVANNASNTIESFKRKADSILTAKFAEDGKNPVPLDPEAVNEVKRVNEKLKDKPESSFTSADHYARGVAYFTRTNYQSAIDSFDKAWNHAPRDTDVETLASYLLAKGVTLGELGRSEEAIALYDQVDQRFGKDESAGVREQVARALCNKGFALGALGRSEEEIALYDQIDQRFGKDEAAGVREKVAGALFNKGITLGALGRSEEAIALYDQVDQRFGKDEAVRIREKVAGALFNEGVTLEALGRSEEAIALYDQVDQRFGKDEAAGVREHVAGALVNKGVTLRALGRTEEAISLYDQVDQRFGKDEAAGVRALAARALFNKGVALGELGRSEEAIALYDQIDQRFGKDEADGVREQVSSALNGSGFLRIMLAKQHWPDEEKRHVLLSESELIIQRSIDLRSVGDRGIRLGNLGYALFLMGRRDEARQPTFDCLKQDGLEGQRADAQQHRVEPEDSQYEMMLDELWNSIKPDELSEGNASGVDV